MREVFLYGLVQASKKPPRVSITCWEKCIIRKLSSRWTVIFKHYSQVGKCSHLYYFIHQNQVHISCRNGEREYCNWRILLGNLLFGNLFVNVTSSSESCFSCSNNLLLLTLGAVWPRPEVHSWSEVPGALWEVYWPKTEQAITTGLTTLVLPAGP